MLYSTEREIDYNAMEMNLACYIRGSENIVFLFTFTGLDRDTGTYKGVCIYVLHAQTQFGELNVTVESKLPRELMASEVLHFDTYVIQQRGVVFIIRAWVTTCLVLRRTKCPFVGRHGY